MLDMFSPGVFAAVLFSSSTVRPFINSGCLLIAFVTTNIVLGLAILVGLDWLIVAVRNEIERTLVNPTQADFFLSFVLGVAMLLMASRSRSEETAVDRETGSLLPETPGKALLAGMFLCLMSAPVAVPYLAMVSQLSSFAAGDISMAVTILLIYNAVWSLPFLIIPLMFHLYGHHADQILTDIRIRLGVAFSKWSPKILVALGSLLIADAMFFFFTRRGLI